jgi:hypothetical protein
LTPTICHTSLLLQELYDAGARRYLLRIESSNPELYAALHPDAMSWQRRVDCLNSLKKIGYMVRCYFVCYFCYSAHCAVMSCMPHCTYYPVQTALAGLPQQP